MPAFTRQMMEALWRAAEGGEARAFATLGECYYAVLVPRGAFDGVAPEPDEARAFSEVAQGIEDPELPPLTFALRCWYEAAVRGDRTALLRFARTSGTGPARARELARELLAELGDPTGAWRRRTRRRASAVEHTCRRPCGEQVDVIAEPHRQRALKHEERRALGVLRFELLRIAIRSRWGRCPSVARHPGSSGMWRDGAGTRSSRQTAEFSEIEGNGEFGAV